MSRTPVEIDEQLVQTLLKQRYVSQADVDCCDMDALAMVHSGLADAQQSEQARRHLQSCRQCQEASMLLSGLLGGASIAPATAQRYALWPGAWLQNMWRQNGFTLAAALATVLVLSVGTYTHFAAQPASDVLVLKGQGDQLAVAVSRAGRKFALRPFDKVEAGDQLGFFYTAAKPGYFGLVAVDRRGDRSILLPTPGEALRKIDAATQKPLLDGAIVEQGTGCEWLLAVFANEAFGQQELEQALQPLRLHEKDCRAEIEIEWARTIVVFPLRR